MTACWVGPSEGFELRAERELKKEFNAAPMGVVAEAVELEVMEKTFWICASALD